MTPKRLVLVGVIAVSLVVVGLVSGCDSEVIKPSVVPAGLISATLQEQVLPKGISDPKFYVYEKSDASVFVAFSGVLTAPDGLKSELYGVRVQLLGPTGNPVGGWGMIGADMKKAFDGGRSRGKKAIEGGGFEYSLQAWGTALDRRTVMIVALTNSGRTLTTTPSNGFWVLEAKDVSEEDAWTSIQAIDGQGGTLFRYPTD